ncbi:MAG: acylphosphatase [Bacteroidia bacterium]
MISIKGKIYGKVQGVFFRKYAKEKARELKLKGIVKNEPDGTVYFEAEGEQEKVEEFKEWCMKGSPGAKVANVETVEVGLKHYKDFQIIY